MEKSEIDNFGSLLRKLRQKKGFSIKTLANKVKVNYSYVSKLENGHSSPSEQFVEKLAAIFDYDKEELLVRAGKIPEDVLEIMSKNPKKAIEFLREEFSD